MKISFLPHCTLLLVLAFSACGAQSKYEFMPRTPGKYEVSVKSGSSDVKNFEQSLVHRVELKKRDLDVMMSSMPDGINIPFSSSPQRDIRGGVTGLKLHSLGGSQNLPNLGLREGDLLTAVNKDHIRDLKDLSKLVGALKAENAASMTLERGGQPHKILYYLKP